MYLELHNKKMIPDEEIVMIHFDFIVNEADAENIFSAISDKISYYYEKKLKCVVDKNHEHAKFWMI